MAAQDGGRRPFLYTLLLSIWIPVLFFPSLAQLETTHFSIRLTTQAYWVRVKSSGNEESGILDE